MKLKLLSILLAAQACALAAFADYSVSGTVVEVNSQSPCINAVYHIYSENDTVNPVINNITDMEGKFKQKIKDCGKYIIRIEYLGTKTQNVPFTISAAMPSANLGIITMPPLANELQELVVTVQKPLVVSDGANLTYNVQEDPAVSTSSILEMLRKVPMVTVDGQDNIRVNGSSDFKIYLNGRSNPMFSSNAQQVLKAMPASSIIKIEVLTEPGAKYEAEGTGGILNIVTQTQSSQTVEDGFSGSVEGNFGVQNWGAGGFLQGKLNRVTASANVNYSNGKLFKRKGFMYNRINYADGSYLENDIQTPQGNNYYYIGGNFSLSWEADSLNLFTLGLNVDAIGAINQMGPGISKTFSPDGTMLSHSLTNLQADFNNNDIAVNASYQHNFNNNGNSLTLSYQFAHTHNPTDIWQSIQDKMLQNMATSYTRTLTTNNSNEHTVQADWSKPFSEKHILELGAKGVFRHNTSISEVSGGNTSFEEMVPIAEENNNIAQYQDIAATYAAYTGHYGKWTLRTGLRYEFTNLGINFKTGKYTDFSSKLNDLVPDLALSFSTTPMHTWRVAYSMRISRPSIDQVNPTIINIMPGYAQMGNPDLGSQKSHNLSLGYSQYAGKASFNLRLGYKFVNNLISRFSFQKDGVIYETAANMGKYNEASLNGYLNYNFSDKIQAGLYGTLSYAHYSLPDNALSMHGWQGNLGANISYIMPKGFSMSAYGGWAGRQYQAQGWFSGWHYYGIGVTKKLLSDKMEISLNANNMFEHYTSFSNYTRTKDSENYGKYKMQNWGVAVSIKWNFGSLKASVKKTNAIIDNDDKASIGSQNGTGGAVNK